MSMAIERPRLRWPSARRKGRTPRQAPVRELRPIRAGSAEETVAWVSSALTMVPILCGWLLLQVLLLGGITAQRDQSILYTQLRAELAAATAPTTITTPGEPVALLSIPKLGLQQVVVEGTASGDLMAGPGHRRDTVMPGQAGVSAIYGRARTHGAPFRDITTLRPGDDIVAQSAQGRTTFTVMGVRRAGDPVPAALKAGEARLTLVSAEGDGLVGRLGAGKVVYVDATSSKAFPAAVPPGPVPASEQAMAGEGVALPIVALGLGLLVLATALVVRARQRWSGALVWVVAAPVVLAISWFTTDAVVRLLPNLM